MDSPKNKELRSDESIDFTELGTIETERLPYDKKTRRTGFYILVAAFVLAVLAGEAYAIATGNEDLIKHVMSLFEKIMLVVLAYYFGKNIAKD